MKKRKLIFFAILCVCTLGIMLWRKNYNDSETVTIGAAFYGAGLNEMTAKIDVMGEYGNMYLNQTSRETIVRQIAETIGLTDYTVITEKEDGAIITKIEKQARAAYTVIELISKENTVMSGMVDTTQYVYVNIELYDSIDSAIYYQKKLKSVINDLDMEEIVTINLSGSMNGKADMAVRNVVSDGLLEALSANVIADNKTEDMYTIYAYAKSVEDYITISGKKININISSYYDEKRDKTYFYLATPIINLDY